MIEIEGVDLPGLGCASSPDSSGGYHNVHVAIQRRNRRDELLGLTRQRNFRDLDHRLRARPPTSGFDLKGPYLQCPAGARFICLSWGAVDDAKSFELLRRAKLWLDCIPSEVVTSAVDQGLLVGRLGLTDHNGNPLRAAVRPPLIEWSGGSAK